MTDYDARQLNLMLEKLNSFDNKNISLGHLVSGLDGLQNALKNVNDQWRNSFLRQWGMLEDVYADILDRNIEELPDEYVSLVRGAIQEIRKLISEEM